MGLCCTVSTQFLKKSIPCTIEERSLNLYSHEKIGSKLKTNTLTNSLHNLNKENIPLFITLLRVFNSTLKSLLSFLSYIEKYE